MDKGKKIPYKAWLIYVNWKESRRFSKKKKGNKDNFFEYMFIDSGIIFGEPWESIGL